MNTEELDFDREPKRRETDTASKTKNTTASQIVGLLREMARKEQASLRDTEEPVDVEEAGSLDLEDIGEDPGE